MLCAVAIIGASVVRAAEPSTESRVTACAGIAEAGERLACYDRLANDVFARRQPAQGTAPAQPVASAVSAAQTIPAQTPTADTSSAPPREAPLASAQTGSVQSPAAQTGATPASAAPPATAQTTALSATAQPGAAQAMFGLSGRSLNTPAADAPVRFITARVTRLRSLPAGGFAMDLDNGQIWEQSELTDLHLQEGDAVKISRAALGSFYLTTSSHRGSRVKRVR